MRPVTRTTAADSLPVRARHRRQAHRHFFYGGAIATILVGASVGAWYFARNGVLARTLAPIEAYLADAAVALDLTIQRVEVEGRERVERQAILKALGAGLGAPILSVDLDAAKTRLEAIPWVHSAAVERRLPDQIYIQLVERQPLAIWQHHRRFDLIDRDGTVIPTTRPDDFPSLPQVVGDGAPQAAGDLVEMLASEPDLAAHVRASVRVGERRWNIELDNGVEVALPEAAPEAAWHHLAALDRSDRLLERDIVAVDMRLSDRLVLRLSPDAAKSLIKKTRTTRPAA
jgi:cell division protein FtsQ